jgi:hypothetical protein
MRVSSTYCRANTPPGLKLHNMPLTRPPLEAFANILVKTSTTKLKRRDKGFPYLKPLPVLKVGLPSPLTITLTDPPITILLIHRIHFSTKPLNLGISSKNSMCNLIVCFFIV